jgi:predicted O-methyltransferase YrrM
MLEIGPIQHEDVLLLQAVIKMTAPTKLVEFGYLDGYSSRKFLEVMRDDAQLISYDNSRNGKIDDPRFTFKKKSQTDYEETEVDFIFFDASHDLNLNIIAFEKVYPTLNEGAIIAVHDTGLWNEMVVNNGGKWIGGYYAHQPDERAFVNYLKETYDLETIHFHTVKETRHGMTLLQKYNKLVV